jgi:hypothetical protein
VTTDAATDIAGVFVAPTIDVDKSQVKKGDNIAIFGQTTAKSEVTIQVNSDDPQFAKVKSDATGAYLYNFDTVPLEYGDHSTKSKTSIESEISSYGLAVPFAVGNTSILKKITGGRTCDKRGDVNNDCKVNLVDFSIVAYWYNRSSPPQKVDINGDGKVNLVDFSILAFNWTG